MPELRLNMIAKEWVLIAKEKGVKPEDFIGVRDRTAGPEFVKTCPFCPGNEITTPDEVYRMGDDCGWKIRVISNRFSKLSEEGKPQRWNSKLKIGANAVGVHEVVVDSCFHNHRIAIMPLEALEMVMRTYRERFSEIYNDRRVEHVVIFKNSGQSSGTSLEHSISQIVGIPITPVRVRDRIETYMRHFYDTGTCLMCKTMEDELHDDVRILFNTAHFVSFVPYAALSPFHIWIFPKRHAGSFADIRDGEIADLAFNLKATMSKLYYGLENPDFNYVINSFPPNYSESKFMHWHISIVPRVSYVSGYEIGSGIYINPMIPELSAKFLRDVVIPD